MQLSFLSLSHWVLSQSDSLCKPLYEWKATTCVVLRGVVVKSVRRMSLKRLIDIAVPASVSSCITFSIGGKQKPQTGLRALFGGPRWLPIIFSKELLFSNAGRVCGSYTADVGLRHYCLCLQNYSTSEYSFRWCFYF